MSAAVVTAVAGTSALMLDGRHVFASDDATATVMAARSVALVFVLYSSRSTSTSTLEGGRVVVSDAAAAMVTAAGSVADGGIDDDDPAAAAMSADDAASSMLVLEKGKRNKNGTLGYWYSGI